MAERDESVTRVAALYDIHGNLPALEAVLAEVASAEVDLIVVGGDVLPGPMPAQCLTRLLSLSTPTRFIYGNGDRDVLAAREGRTLSRVPEAFRAGLQWVGERLTEELAIEIHGWPSSVSVRVDGLGLVCFCHATPRDDNEIFTEITPSERLEPVFEPTGADLVVCGHTHMQFDRVVGSVRVVNAGSVGMPFGAPGAFWLLLDREASLRRTEYDTAAATEAIEATGYPEAGIMALDAPRPAAEMLELFEGVALR